MPKSYRIRTEVGVDKHIDVKLEQDFDFLEILSLKINQSDIYIRPCSDYGVIVGRISVNNGFGVPNAKVSVFIPLSDTDEQNPVIADLYPYKTLSDLNEDGYRYNLLPKDPSYSVHAATGTFPTRKETLIDQTQIEIYDKYYKFTVKTNESGDYMIFGVPIGSQTVFMDVDLSDIGCFSLAPQDLIQQGLATEGQVNGSQFKKSSNLNELPQIVTANRIIDVSPLWGEPDICQLGITRCDFDLTQSNNINIQPTAVFMGSIISTTDDDALKKNCKPKNNTGNLCELVAGPGQIQAIRQTIFLDNQNLPILEEYQFEQNGNVIDGDGSYLVNVPMNLDYIITNEFGQQVISNDPTKGIPTKGKYRFKFKWNNEGGLQSQFLRANFLVPNIKEYGWSTSSSDPFDPTLSTQFFYTLPIGQVNGTPVGLPGTGGLVLENTSNVNDFSIYLNGSLYTGDPNVIPIAGGNISVVANPVDPNLPQTLNFTYYPTNLFNVLRSYTFSLDWDDYINVQDAINCEDTFYEFNYNKVYTTSMFLDRYKNGLGRARHLGIKEIDNRTCKSTVNTFPVNDIIRNFDFLFFVFNLLINILTFPILVLLFIAHFICYIWPILKYALIFLGLYFLYQQVQAGIELTNSIIELTATAVPGGPVINTGVILRTVWEAIVILLKAALAIIFIIFVVKKLVKINNFPRIGLPMLSYPECNTCDCDCKNAPQDDDFDSNTVGQDIQNQQNALSGGNQPPTAQSNSFLAPLNLPQTYTTTHPNFEQRPGYNANDNEGGYFLYCNSLFGIPLQYKSLTNRLVAQDIEAEVATQAILDFKRLFSGYDVLSGSDFNRFKAPQPFLFAAEQETDFPFPPPPTINPDKRYFGRPRTVTYPQRLNEFNTRDKFFSGANKIKTVVNPSLPGAQPYEDQIIVMIAQIGTTVTIGAGNLFSFQNPKQSPCQINLTGATLNQFGNNAITGTSLTNPIAITSQLQYATSQNTNSAPVPITIIQSGSSENYLRYPTDIEYYQVITGMTISTFEGLADFTNGNYFPQGYLYHNIGYDIITPPECDNPTVLPAPVLLQVTNQTTRFGKQVNNYTAIKEVSQYGNYEIIFVVRGVDPHTEKQTISYDLSRIFGETTFGSGPVIEGSYYLNQPIQGYPGGNKPKSHDTTTNVSTDLYFPSFTFTPDSIAYTSFTSNLPYYFVSTDETPTYQPVGTHPQTVLLSPGMVQVAGTNFNKLPKYNNTPIDFGGGTFIAFQNASYPLTPVPVQSFFIGYTDNVSVQDQKMQYGWPGSPPNWSTTQVYALYSSAYYNLGLPGVDFSDSNNIVMRSDRLPTSTRTEGGPNGSTGYGLHQNNNFTYYTVSALSDGGPTTSIGGNLPSGEGADTENQSLINTLTCENLVPLACYQGSGVNVTVNPNCSIPADRVVRGCYCLLNKTYLFQYDEDVRLFLEWKTRFTITFAACRGVFAQAFQNNWINGVLYMFNFNKTTVYNGLFDTTPDYNYCKDTIIFNDLENNFYYRSSPWDGNNFIGKDAPQPQSFWPQSLITGYPGLGYNKKQIQFPTTIMDMGPRESFIAEICNNNNFNGYLVDQIKSSSYQDNSDLIQIGFLSRLLNDNFRQAIIPIANPNGNNTEGKGIIQFFNSTREADRIDGDFAQMLSINSEWRINAFLAENYQNPASIFFENDSQTGDGYPRPVFGVFFETDDIDYTYRRRLSPGNEYYSITPPLYYQFGYPKTQNVPHYRWKIEILSNNYIFGNENNNWDTNVTQTGGFFTKGYQNLDFNSDPYFQSSFNGTVQEGYITNLSGSNTPDPNYNVGTTPPGSSIIVGAPYHFYFGLNNGKTAIDKFVKLYINNPDA